MRAAEQTHAALKAVERQRKHAPAHQLAGDADGLMIIPHRLGLGIEPDRIRIHLQRTLQPYRAGLFIAVFDAAAGISDLYGLIVASPTKITL